GLTTKPQVTQEDPKSHAQLSHVDRSACLRVLPYEREHVGGGPLTWVPPILAKQCGQKNVRRVGVVTHRSFGQAPLPDEVLLELVLQALGRSSFHTRRR